MLSIYSSAAGDILFFVFQLLSRVYNTLIIIIIIPVFVKSVYGIYLCILILSYYNITRSCGGRYRRSRSVSRHSVKRGKSEEHNEHSGGVNIVFYASILYIYTDSVKFVMPTYASA